MINKDTAPTGFSYIFPWDIIYNTFPIFWIAFAFVIGAFAASLWGVLVYRLPVIYGVHFTEYSRALIEAATDDDKTLLNRSHCDKCGRQLSWCNLLPIVGYLISRGKCSGCGAKIPVVYPIMEGLTGLLCAVALYLTHGSLIVIPFITWMILIAWMDDRTQWIPDGFTLPVIATGLMASLLGITPIPLDSSVEGMLAGFFSIFLAFGLISILKRDNYMNYGDMFLFAGLGAWFGLCSLCFLLAGTALLGIPYVIFSKIRHHYGLARIEYVKGQENATTSQDEGGQVGIPMGPLMAMCAIIILIITLCEGHALSIMNLVE